MTAHYYRWQAVITTGSAGKDITHLVDADGTSGIFTPGHKEITTLLIQIGQCQAADSALFCSTDLAHLHQAVPQTLSIYFYSVHWCLLRFIGNNALKKAPVILRLFN